jgi:hypothetical protein
VDEFFEQLVSELRISYQKFQEIKKVAFDKGLTFCVANLIEYGKYLEIRRTRGSEGTIQLFSELNCDLTKLVLKPISYLDMSYKKGCLNLYNCDQ